MTCPLGKKDCQGCEYLKEGLCDYPYKVGMMLKEIKKVTLIQYNKDKFCLQFGNCLIRRHCCIEGRESLDALCLECKQVSQGADKAGKY